MHAPDPKRPSGQELMHSEKYGEWSAKQKAGTCLNNHCSHPSEPREYLCKEHWLALPAPFRSEIIRSRNFYRNACSRTREEARRRFQEAWMRAVLRVNDEPSLVIQEAVFGG